MSRTYYVNGYGVPKNILDDSNYQRYLSAVLTVLRISEQPLIVYLAGGATNTNYPEKTEAGEMLRWFQSCPDLPEIDFRLIDTPVDARDNLQALQLRIGEKSSVTIFCEYARQDSMRFLARKMFTQAHVHPIQFDLNRHQVLARLRQIPRLFLRIMGWYLPWVRRYIEFPLRLRFIKKWGEETSHRP